MEAFTRRNLTWKEFIVQEEKKSCPQYIVIILRHYETPSTPPNYYSITNYHVLLMSWGLEQTGMPLMVLTHSSTAKHVLLLGTLII